MFDCLSSALRLRADWFLAISFAVVTGLLRVNVKVTSEPSTTLMCRVSLITFSGNFVYEGYTIFASAFLSAGCSKAVILKSFVR